MSASHEDNPEQLDARIAREALGWTPVHRNSLAFWYAGKAESKNYKGVIGDTGLRWSKDINLAFTLLARHCWGLGTCDDGYSCTIYTAPEAGEEVLGVGVGDTISMAICNAVLDAQPKIKAITEELLKKAERPGCGSVSSASRE